jgi:hypothetical protein
MIMKTQPVRSALSSVASELYESLNERHSVAAGFEDKGGRDPDFQRVYTYVADVLKDSHVLFAKLARLQGDFKGRELQDLISIAEGVLDIGDRLSVFSRALDEGSYSISESEITFSDDNAAPEFGSEPSEFSEQSEEAPMAFGQSMDSEPEEDYSGMESEEEPESSEEDEEEDSQ